MDAPALAQMGMLVVATEGNALRSWKAHVIVAEFGAKSAQLRQRPVVLAQVSIRTRILG